MALKSKMGAATKEIVELRVLRAIMPGQTMAGPTQLKLQFRRKSSNVWHDVPVVDVDIATGKMVDDEN